MSDILRRNANTIISRAGPRVTQVRGVQVEEYFKSGNLHREDGAPAYIERHLNTGVVILELYKENGELHRTADLPAVIQRDSNGIVTRQQWFERGKCHRAGGKPALVRTDPETGEVFFKAYWKNGKLHRTGGQPAWICRRDYFSQGALVVCEDSRYYKNDVELPAPPCAGTQGKRSHVRSRPAR